MKGIITKIFRFEAAHFLPGHSSCGLIHGHSFVLEVSVEGEVKNHFVIDFSELKSIVNSYAIDKLDHKLLNDIFIYPSCEEISFWIWKQLEEPLKLVGVKLQRVKLSETVDNYFCYYGDRNGDKN